MRPTKATFDLVVRRDSGSCAHCGTAVWGERGFNFSLHHRRPAGMGGDRRPEAHKAGNLILLHGHGVSFCHGFVERERTWAMGAGFLVERFALPASKPIKHAVHGWCLLTDDGSVTPAKTPALAAAEGGN